MNTSILVFLFTIKLIFGQDRSTLGNIISTTSGDVQGYINTTVYGVRYSSFKGIPYGEVLIRFQVILSFLKIITVV